MAGNDPTQERVQFMLNRQDVAYKVAPVGSWAQRWIPGICKHATVRCTHGAEIIHRRWRRRVCMICGRSLKGPLPDECFFTGEPHLSTRPAPPEPPQPGVPTMNLLED